MGIDKQKVGQLAPEHQLPFAADQFRVILQFGAAAAMDGIWGDPGVAADKFTRWLGTHGSQAGAQICLWAEAGEQKALVRRWREQAGEEEVFFML